ncbi:hypothetical protein VTO58DRAFT_110263 [Aureobasidium pullulans]
MRAWTWEDHDNNAACEICTRAPLGGLHEINQCLKVTNVDTLWLLNPKDSDWAKQEECDEQNNAARPLQHEPPAFGGDAAQDIEAFESHQSGSTPVEESRTKMHTKGHTGDEDIEGQIGEERTQ